VSRSSSKCQVPRAKFQVSNLSLPGPNESRAAPASLPQITPIAQMQIVVSVTIREIRGPHASSSKYQVPNFRSQVSLPPPAPRSIPTKHMRPMKNRRSRTDPGDDRLPKEFRFPGKTVTLRRTAKGVAITPDGVSLLPVSKGRTDGVSLLPVSRQQGPNV